MELTDSQIQTANTMASEGYTVADISRYLELPEWGGWGAVREHVESWRGVKQSISLQLTSLVDEPDVDKRREKRVALEARIDFLYNQAHGVANKIAVIREALDG